MNTTTTRDEMLHFLRNGETYKGAVARNIKVHSLGLTREQRDACYAALAVEDAHFLSGFNDALDEFSFYHEGHKIYSDGRSGGWLVLHVHGRPFTFNAEDAEDYSDDELRALYETVLDFDQAVNHAVQCFVAHAMENQVVEETIMVPKKVLRFQSVQSPA